MSEILIDVLGTANTTAPAEVGVLHAAICADGPEPQPVKDKVVATAARVRSSLEALQAGGAVTTFAVEQVRITAERPWNDQGEQRPLVHSASVGVEAHFEDFEALSQWVLTDGLTVHRIDWRLTDQTLVTLERQTRQAALRNAVRQAQDYADTLDLGRVQVRTVRDAGVQPAPRMMMAAAMDGAGGTLELSPAPIEISADVHAGFTVSAA